MLVMRVACELGKWPDEIESTMSTDDLLEFAGYFSYLNGEPEKKEDESVEGKLIKVLGKPT